MREQDPGVERDQYNYVTCVRPIYTKKIRIEVQLHDELSGGVLGCRFHAPAQKDVEAACDDPDDELQRIKTLAKATLDDDVDEFNGYSHLNGNRPEFDGWLNKQNNKLLMNVDAELKPVLESFPCFEARKGPNKKKCLKAADRDQRTRKKSCEIMFSI